MDHHFPISKLLLKKVIFESEVNLKPTDLNHYYSKLNYTSYIIKSSKKPVIINNNNLSQFISYSLQNS